MSSEQGALTIDIPADPSHVVLVRHALSGLADSVGMDEEAVADVKTVVTEACMNAVLHAYPAGHGRVRVKASKNGSGLMIRVSDDGVGIRPGEGGRHEGSSLRLGMTLIAALSASYEISGGAGKGTTVTIYMPAVETDAESSDQESAEPFDQRIGISAGGPDLLSPVLARTLSAFAATGQLSVDQVSDSMLLGDALAACAPDVFSDADPRFSLAVVDAGVELTVGPLNDGARDRLSSSLQLPDGAGSIETLADEVRTESSSEGGSMMIFRIAKDSSHLS